jgi:tetraacyldisaccharide 4'-kinase
MRTWLLPFSWLYGLGIGVRNLLFDIGVLPSEKFPIPVICIGNLIAGGSGKSPHVLWLAEVLKSDFKVAILSRGYGRKTKGFRLLSEKDTALTAGDEPLQYLFYLKNVQVAVCEDRREGISRLLSSSDAPQVILLDDAYQHRYVKAGFNVLITEGMNPFTADFLLPAGMLREGRKGAKRADWVVVSKTPADFDAESLKQAIGNYTKAPISFSYMQYREPIGLLNESAVDLANKDVFLFTGIARPEPLLSYVKDKANKVHHQRYPDHYQFSVVDLKKMMEDFHLFKEHDQTILLTTRKDAMRLMEPELKELLKEQPVYVIDIQAAIEDMKFKEAIVKYVRSNS